MHTRTKALICSAIFLLLLTGAWVADQKMSGLNEARSAQLRMQEAHSIKPQHRPREYVRIVPHPS